jgi:hypothetical protein
METVWSSETLVPTSPHGITAENNNIDIFTAAITSNLTKHYTEENDETTIIKSGKPAEI